MGAPRACATHAALACVGAVLLAVACHLAPPPYARTGSGLGVVEGQLQLASLQAVLVSSPWCPKWVPVGLFRTFDVVL